MNRNPSSHVWKQVEHGLWRCRYCDGYVASIVEPSPEAVARSEAEARTALATKAAAPQEKP